MIEIDKVNFDGILSSFKKEREGLAYNLKRKLDRAEKWQARFVKLTDAKIEAAAAERLEKIKKLAVASHITIYKLNVGSVNASYHRGDVTMELSGWLQISNEGIVSLDLFTYAPGYQRAVRISVGKRTTITNNILQILMSKT